ncbi:MAG: VWA domain-containing protein [Opitutales bacterium]
MFIFTQPWAFLALAAIALPVLAHMAFRRTTKRQLFPSLRFIRPSRIPRTGRKTPADWLLLILRILLFALLACTLADPRWVKPGTVGDGQQTIILLDQSASMAGWGAWNEAQKEILQVLDESEGEIGFLGFGSEPLAQSEVPPTEDRALVRQTARDAKPTADRGNPQAAVERALRTFARDAKAKTLIVVTDLQRTNWQSVAHKLAEASVALDLRIVGRSSAEGSNRPNNLTLCNTRTAPVGLDELRVWAQVRNSSSKEIKAVLVLEAGGEERGRRDVAIAPHQAAQAQFVLPRGDFAVASVRIESDPDDAFSMDDSRELWLKAPPPRRFGFLAGSDEATLTERGFLEAVLQSAGDAAWDRWILAQENAEALLSGDASAVLDVLLMPGMQSIEEEASVKSMMGFMERGGVVLATPGEPYAATVANLREIGLLELSFKGIPGGARDRSEPFRFAAFDPDTSLGKVFEGKPARDIQLASLSKYGEVEPLSKNLSVRLRAANKHPLVFERKVGKGRFLFFAFRLDMSWSDLPARNSFLPLLVELIKGEGGEDRSWPRLEVGDRLTLGEETFVAEEPGTFRFRDQFLEVTLPISETSSEIFDRVDAIGILGADKKLAGAENDQTSNQEAGEPLWIWFAIGCAVMFLIENLWVSPRSLGEAKTSDA